MRKLFAAFAALMLAGGVAACGDDEPAQIAQTVPNTPPPAAQDPCQPMYFNAALCQQAQAAHGYYWYGTFYPMIYPHPYSWYFGSYTTYYRRGGRVIVASPGFYSRTYVYPRTRTIYRANPRYSARSSWGSGSRSSAYGSSGTSRGGFGSTGSARAGGFGGGFGG